MKVSNQEAWEAWQAVSLLCQQPWPVKTAWQLVRLTQKLASHARPVEEVRNGLIQRYGEVNERGQPQVTAGTDGHAFFVKAWSELASVEIEVDVEPVVLPMVKGIDLRPATLIAAGAFILEEGADAGKDAARAKAGRKRG